MLIKKNVEKICVSLINTGIISFVLSLINQGNAFLWTAWIESWLIAFIIIIPLGYMIPALLHKVISKVVKIARNKNYLTL